jgi:hypothetical protein
MPARHWLIIAHPAVSLPPGRLLSLALLVILAWWVTPAW